jgi:hypothetical protein
MTHWVNKPKGQLMENEMWVTEDYKSYIAKYSLINIYKETYGPPIS